MNNLYEIRSVFKNPVLGCIVSYGSYATEKEARKELKKLAVSNFANSKEIRELGLQLIQYVAMPLETISPLDMMTTEEIKAQVE